MVDILARNPHTLSYQNPFHDWYQYQYDCDTNDVLWSSVGGSFAQVPVVVELLDTDYRFPRTEWSDPHFMKICWHDVWRDSWREYQEYRQTKGSPRPVRVLLPAVLR